MAEKLGKVSWSVEHVPETHRTLNADHTITTDELPGMVNVYLHVGDGKILFTSYKSGKVFDAIEQAKAAKSNGDTENVEE